MIKVYACLMIFVLIFGGLYQQKYMAYCALETGYIRRSNGKALYVFIALVLIFVAGCRYYVGTDFGAYYHGYTYYAAEFWQALKTLDEPGLRLIYYITSKIWNNGAACVFAAAAVTLGLELKYLYRNTDQRAYALMLFLLLVWGSCFNGVRQALAVAVLCMGFPHLKSGRFLPYAWWVFLAFLCHKSAIVMILVWFVCRRKITWKHLLFLAVASTVVLLSTDRVFQITGLILSDSADISGYMSTAYWTRNVNKMRVAAYMAPAIFFLFTYWKKERTEDEEFYLNLLLVHGLVSLVTSFSTCIARMTLYTSPYLVVAIPELLKGFKPQNRKILFAAILLLYFIFNCYECRGESWQWIWNR